MTLVICIAFGVIAYLACGWMISVYVVASANIRWRKEDRYSPKPDAGMITVFYTLLWPFIGLLQVVAIPFVQLDRLQKKLVDHTTTVLTTKKKRFWVEDIIPSSSYRSPPRVAGHWETRRVPKESDSTGDH